MRNLPIKVNHNWTARILGVSALTFSLVELTILLKMSLWRAMIYMHEPQIPNTCKALTPDDRVFYARLWLTTAVASSALAGAISAWCALTVASLWQSGGHAGRVKRVSTIIFKAASYGLCLLFLSPKIMVQDLGCFNDDLRVFGSGVLFYVAIALVMAAIWGVELRLKTIPLNSTNVQCLYDYVNLRSGVQLLFALGSLVLVCSVVQDAMRQRFVLALSGSVVRSRADVLLQGLRYTLLLAIAYVPVHLSFNVTGEGLLEQITRNLASLDGEEVKKWAEQKKASEELLSLNSYEWKAFGPGIAVIAPAVAGFISKIVDGLAKLH